MNNISFEQYRKIDLTILSVLTVVSEGLVTLATDKWFVGVPFAISTSLLFILITMMRWGVYAVIPAVLGGAVRAFASGAEPKIYLIYALGNAFCVLTFLALYALGKERVRKSIPLLISYSVLSYIYVAFGRWLVSLIFEPSILTLPAYLMTDAVSLLFVTVVLVLIRNTDGMIEDQRAYIIRINSETEKAAARYSDEDDLEEIYDDPNYLDGIYDDDDGDEPTEDNQ